MKKTFSILSIIAIITGCQAHGTDTGNIIPVVPVVTGTEYCPLAETHLQKLCDNDPVNNYYCCEVVAPTKMGLPFQMFCKETQDQGISLDPKCLSEVVSCGDIDKCTHTVVAPSQAALGCDNNSCSYPRK